MRRRSALAALAAAAVGTACGQAENAQPRWPALAVRDLAGRPLNLPASGGARLVNLWALWCPPCRRELPSLDRLAPVLAGRGVGVTAIAIADDTFPVREYLVQHGLLRLHNVVLPAGMPGLQALRVQALPQTFVVGADGAVLARWIGEREWDGAAVRRELEAALEAA